MPGEGFSLFALERWMEGIYVRVLMMWHRDIEGTRGPQGGRCGIDIDERAMELEYLCGVKSGPRARRAVPLYGGARNGLSG